MILTAASLILYLLSIGSQNQHVLEAVDATELTLHLLSLAALVLAAIKLTGVTHVEKKGVMTLDTWLVVVGQSGVTLHCLFKIIAVCFSGEGPLTGQLVALIQSLAQSVFIVQKWSHRTNNPAKPARQLITFLLLCNAGMWCINTLVRNKVVSDEGSLQFYGPWEWIAISRITMPLNIFYRFHSTICLFEIWKNMYKPPGRGRSLAQLEASL